MGVEGKLERELEKIPSPEARRRVRGRVMKQVRLEKLRYLRGQIEKVNPFYIPVEPSVIELPLAIGQILSRYRIDLGGLEEKYQTSIFQRLEQRRKRPGFQFRLVLREAQRRLLLRRVDSAIERLEVKHPKRISAVGQRGERKVESIRRRGERAGSYVVAYPARKEREREALVEVPKTARRVGLGVSKGVEVTGQGAGLAIGAGIIAVAQISRLGGRVLGETISLVYAVTKRAVINLAERFSRRVLGTEKVEFH